jgi:hypothetical protein
METDQEIKVEMLEDILNKAKPHDLLTEASPLLQPLAQFVVQYTMCMTSRSDMKANICSDQEDSHDVDSKAEKKNMFKCVC